MIYLVLSTDVDTGNMVDPFNQPDTCWYDMNRKFMFILGLAWVFIVRVTPVQVGGGQSISKADSS